TPPGAQVGMPFDAALDVDIEVVVLIADPFPDQGTNLLRVQLALLRRVLTHGDSSSSGTASPAPRWTGTPRRPALRPVDPTPARGAGATLAVTAEKPD